MLFPQFDSLWQEYMIRSETRYAAQFKIFEQLDADILCLNEVTPFYLQQLVQQKFIRDKYFVSENSSMANKTFGPKIGNLMLCKYDFPLMCLKIPTLRSKIVACCPNASTTIAAVHLSSKEHNGKMRKLELQQILAGVATKHVILMGDFNMHLPSEETILEELQLEDLWAKTNTSPGYTFDAESNWFIKVKFLFGETRQMRLDRIVCNKGCEWIEDGAVKLFANQAICDYLYPSDHYGLTVQLASKM